MVNWNERIVTGDLVSTNTSTFTSFTVAGMVTVGPSFVEFFSVGTTPTTMATLF